MLFILSPFLAVQTSYWPLLVSLILFSRIINIVLYISGKIILFRFIISVTVLIILVFLWWGDLRFEGLIGYHTHKLEFGFRVGMLLFILSEVFFFLRFF